MTTNYIATASTTIKADAAKVWEALTKPEIVKQYFFGTEMRTDWKVGSPITYSGVWEGKPYNDKGKVLEVVPNKRIKSTFWSALSGLPDKPENYNTITYELSGANGETTLTIHQDNNPTQESADHSAGNWKSVLQALKTLLEK